MIWLLSTWPSMADLRHKSKASGDLYVGIIMEIMVVFVCI
jgi:hypothetical protein